MNTIDAQKIDVTTNVHQIATNRGLHNLMQWAEKFTANEAKAGRRSLWVPCQALQGSVSLRSWLTDRAGQMFDSTDSMDAPTLLSGAADILVIVDPASADQGSLNWLSGLLACAKEVEGVTSVPPLPQLVVLAPGRKGGDEKVVQFVNQLRDLGAKELRAPGREGDVTPESLAKTISKLKSSHGKLLATLSLMPCPIDEDGLDALAVASGSNKNAIDAIRKSELFFGADGILFPLTREIGASLRKQFTADELGDAAQALLPVCEARFGDLPDARVEILMLSGDHRRAAKLARRRFDDHLSADRFEEALRILRLATRLGLSIETSKNAAEIDQAKMAALYAENGDYDQAKSLVAELKRKRDLYDNPEFVRWIAVASRTLAMRTNHDARGADSLMRRAIRMYDENSDTRVHLTLLRVDLLNSSAFGIPDRADWLLSHVSNAILEHVSKATLAHYLDVSASRLVAKKEYKGAIKRLRRLAPISTSDRQLSRAMIMMAECRKHVSDRESATRYASSAIQYGLRSASAELVRKAAALLKRIEKDTPRALPKQITKGRGRLSRGIRIPSAAEIATPKNTDAEQLFEILESRFGVLHWERRRDGGISQYGEPVIADADGITVYQEGEAGSVVKRCEASSKKSDFKAIVLMRADGSDLVYYDSPDGTDAREDSILKFLLADRTPESMTTNAGEVPSRDAVVIEYMRRAVAHKSHRGLHGTMETMFNKDILIYFEDQGFGKEDMAEKLGVSRATLYRMYVRAGLN
ncbi:hypothetical protein OAU50_00310 [Planctomycetota bacterium]|nr:hypothetical protein [Planctomycetota bacterium]